MSLARRRFPDTIRRRREGPGEYGADGEYVPGKVTDTEFRASVQPLALEDTDVASGAILAETIKLYIPAADALAAAFASARADRVVLADGREFVVQESRTWLGHTRATLFREI